MHTLKERYKMNNLIFQVWKLVKKKEQIKSNRRRNKEIIKFGAKINNI